MSSNEIHVGDVGTVFVFTIKDSDTTVDISACVATDNLLLAKPAGTISTLSAAFVTDGTDGKIKFTTSASTFEQMGTHQFQAIIKDGTNSWKTDIHKFHVYPNLE